MSLEIRIKDNKVTVWRQRAATKAERARDPGAKHMVEVIEISFDDLEAPSTVLNRNLVDS